ncbi:MAG: hypothetical protein AAFX85_12210, partial [Pseudomonadota bacterium]
KTPPRPGGTTRWRRVDAVLLVSYLLVPIAAASCIFFLVYGTRVSRYDLEVLVALWGCATLILTLLVAVVGGLGRLLRGSPELLDDTS